MTKKFTIYLLTTNCTTDTYVIVKNRNLLHFVSVNINQYECKYDSIFRLI